MLLVRGQVRQLQPGAVASWWQPGHPGWAIYPVDSEQFMSTGALDSVSVPNEQIVAPQPQMGGDNPTILLTHSFCYSKHCLFIQRPKTQSIRLTASLGVRCAEAGCIPQALCSIPTHLHYFVLNNIIHHCNQANRSFL